MEIRPSMFPFLAENEEIIDFMSILVMFDGSI